MAPARCRAGAVSRGSHGRQDGARLSSLTFLHLCCPLLQLSPLLLQAANGRCREWKADGTDTWVGSLRELPHCASRPAVVEPKMFARATQSPSHFGTRAAAPDGRPAGFPRRPLCAAPKR